MKQDELIKQLFIQETSLPLIIKERKQEAYNTIYAQASESTNEHGIKTQNATSLLKPRFPKVAVFLLISFLVAGGTTYAAMGIINRWERMRKMDKETVEQLYNELQSSGHLSFQTSRPLTQAEQQRYRELEKAYKNNQAIPDSELPRFATAEEYSGKGIWLQLTEAGEEHILHLPETELTDEELLEIIDYEAKLAYALYETKKEALFGEESYENRLNSMTDEEVNYYYLAMFSHKMDIADALCRGVFDPYGPSALTESEKTRYQELEKEYKEANRIPEEQAVVIENPEDYSGKGIALCRYDGNFYLPPEELTDEEILQIIDFRSKGNYSVLRIREEIAMGYRTNYPKLPEETELSVPTNEHTFSQTDGKGSMKERKLAQIGDIIQFGSYEQDNNPKNGTEAIHWYVLDATEDSLTLLSVDILDAMFYSEKQEKTTWETSDMRQWLNETFYYGAFNDTEQASILTSVVITENSSNTEDKVYILSYPEVLEYFGVSSDALMDFSSAKENAFQHLQNLEQLDSRLFVMGTEAAHANGLWSWTEETSAGYIKFHNIDFSEAIGNSAWWLRTTDKNSPSAYTISANGDVHSAQYVNTTQGVRPVIQIKR